jgi:membrane-bound metal-dependent hydrolase YbcI (DUF457 family)
MMAAGHLLSGALAGVLAAPLMPLPHSPAALPVFVGVTTVAALVPDMDQPGSKLSRVLGPITWLLAWLTGWISRVVYEATKTPLDKPCGNGHRTLTHTLIFALLLGGAVYGGMAAWAQTHPAIQPWTLTVALAATLGCWAHLAGDALTIHGIPAYWPVQRGGKRWGCVGAPHVLRFRTGGGKAGRGRRHATVSSYGGVWAAIGESVVTFVLLAGFIGVAGATVVGGGSWMALLP